MGGMETGERTRPLLAPGNEAEWTSINAEDDEYRREATRAMTPAQRIVRGQALSKQAVALLAAAVKAGNVPRRVFWT